MTILQHKIAICLVSTQAQIKPPLSQVTDDADLDETDPGRVPRMSVTDSQHLRGGHIRGGADYAAKNPRQQRLNPDCTTPTGRPNTPETQERTYRQPEI